MAAARHDFLVSAYVSLAGNGLAILLGAIALGTAPRGSGARTMGILGLILGLVGLAGSLGLFGLSQ